MKDTKNHFLQHKFNFFTETFSVHKISGIAVSWKKIKTGKEQQKLNWNFSHFFYFLFHYVSWILWFPLYLIWFKSLAREHMLIVEYKNKTYNTIQYTAVQYSTCSPQYSISMIQIPYEWSHITVPVSTVINTLTIHFADRIFTYFCFISFYSELFIFLYGIILNWFLLKNLRKSQLLE